MPQSIESWWEEGSTERIALGRDEREVFVKRQGSGPTVTLLHGFPSSSHDWARLAPSIDSEHALLMPDFLGFGASEKPVEHDYTLHEQADLTEELWRRDGITETIVLAHDYAVSVTQELLARRAEGTLNTEIRAVVFMNGGIYPDLHRAQPGQIALRDPEHGPAISAIMNEELFTAGVRPTFAEAYDAGPDSAEMWKGIHRSDGEKISHLLINYMRDREQHGERWVGALESTDVPLAFVWGMLDPVSGAHIAQRIRERLPDAPLTALDDVAHWPPLEAPERIAQALRHG